MLFHIDPLRLWVHKVLPVVYDDSLSYYEVLAKVTKKLNEVIDLTEEQNQYIEEFSTNLTNAINNWEDGMEREWSSYKSDLNNEWGAFQRNTEQYIENWKNMAENDIEDAIAAGINQFVSYFSGLTQTAVDAAEEAMRAAETAAQDAVDAVMPTLESEFDERYAWKTAVGSPLVATTAAGMTDTTKVYVYAGSETGYVNGDWYYYDGTAWQDGGVYNSAAVVTDPTLSQSGVPADAKAAGDEIADLKSAISISGQNTERQISVSANKIIEADCVWGEYVSTTAVISASSVNWGHTHPIFICKNVSYKFKVSGTYGGYKTAYLIVKDDGTYAAGGNLGTDTDGYVTFTATFTGYITVNITRNGSQMFCETAKYPDTYVTGTYINRALTAANDNISSLQNTVAYNAAITAPSIIDGGCYITSNGLISTAQNTQRLCAARVIQGITYHISTHIPAGQEGWVYAYYDKYTTPAAGDISYNGTRYSHDGDNGDVVAPISGWIVFRSAAGYSSETITPVTANDGISRYTKDNNPLIGKMIAVDGDSICYGNGYLGGYAKIIADSNSMYYQNLAVGGATMVTGTQAGGVNRHWISTSVANLSSNADYIIVEGGANDSSMQAVTLGSLTETYNATLDTTTFYGAVETTFKTLTTKYVGKKYGFLIVHGILHSFMPGGDFYNAIYDCAKKWGVPILDLTKFVPPFNQFRHDDTLDSVRTTYTTEGDGWHPTELCYRQYYVPIIEAWLKTL